MELEWMKGEFTVCKLENPAQVDWTEEVLFLGKTDRELSLVCRTQAAPVNCLAREDGWMAFRVAGALDFSLVGILAELASLMARAGIGIFALSTYDTDYILLKKENAQRAGALLERAGHRFL